MNAPRELDQEENIGIRKGSEQDQITISLRLRLR